MKIAAVDPGGNSLHMVVVEATTSGGVARRAELMREVFGVPVRIDVVPAGADDARGARRA